MGLLSNYNTKINDNLTFDFGVDIRSYKGYHYRRVDNLLGADGYRDNDDINNPLNIQSTAYSSDLAQQWNVFRSTEDEQKINYYNIGKVRWASPTYFTYVIVINLLLIFCASENIPLLS